MIPYKVIDKIAIGPINLYTWGLFVGLGFLSAWFLLLKEARRQKVDSELVMGFALWIIIGSLVGSRLLFVIENFDLFVQDFWGIFKIWEGGLSYYGGFLGGISVSLFYIKKHGLKSRKTLYILAFVLPLGIAIGRLGCFLINDHLGEVTNVPWGILYPDGSSRHPVALYLSVSALLCFVFLVIIKRYLKSPGMLLVFFLLWYGFSRFTLDFTRSHNPSLPFADKHYFGLTLAQYLSIGLFLVGGYLLFKWRNIKSSNN